MSSVLIVCATVVLIVALCLGAYLYVTISERQQRMATAVAAWDKQREQERVVHSRIEFAITAIQDVSDKLRAADKPTADAILAFSERMVVFEAALKAAIAEMVNATGYSAAKYQELIAAQVRRGNAPGKKQGVPA